jgi:hypothetical protein
MPCNLETVPFGRAFGDKADVMAWRTTASLTSSAAT